MKKTKYFIGLDISAETIDAAVYLENHPVITFKERFSNDPEGFNKLENVLKARGIDQNNSAICLEITGSYSEHVCYYLHSRNFSVWAETPYKVSRTFRNQTKNDTVSAIQIAEYCYRYIDVFKPFEPNESIVEQVKTLLATREQLVTQSTAHKNSLNAFKRKYYQTPLANTLLADTIKHLDKSVKQIEKELDKLIKKNSRFGQTASALDKIPGIGTLFIANFFVVTNGFAIEANYRKMASYLGICPHEHRSGTSVYKRPKSSGHGHSRLRKLLYLASMSVRQHNPKFHNYFIRKLAEGKNKHLIINNIANKLLRIVCAISKNNMDYSGSFVSVHPKFLKY